ncbi:Rmf/CrpP fold protein [Actinomadura macra]|uniref:Rmf/CrpP fold protein n=1 Tax=Actinomadura macra TaxID=46164 RepID=UPI00083729FF|nr:Rmf/CrpP fold protein [Actinomadura macra]
MTAQPGDKAAGLALLRAHQEGQSAARAGQPLTACPYPLDTDDPVTRARARMWLRGHDRVDPFPIDYSG